MGFFYAAYIYQIDPCCRIQFSENFYNYNFQSFNLSNQHSSFELIDIRNFDNNGLEKNVVISKNDSLIYLNFSPKDIINTASSSEEVSYLELKKQIQSLKNNGVNTLRWEVDLNYKIAYSFISIIVIFCGIPLSVYRSNTTYFIFKEYRFSWRIFIHRG